MIPRASIVVVAMRDGPMLRDCLGRLAELPDDVSFEVIVVLCGCDSADARQLQADAPARGIKVLHSPINLGLAGALNLARDAVEGEFIVSLHDDAQPAAGWLSALVRAADEDPGAGAIGSLVLNPDGSDRAGRGHDPLAVHDGLAPERVIQVDYFEQGAAMIDVQRRALDHRCTSIPVSIRLPSGARCG